MRERERGSISVDGNSRGETVNARVRACWTALYAILFRRKLGEHQPVGLTPDQKSSHKVYM